METALKLNLTAKVLCDKEGVVSVQYLRKAHKQINAIRLGFAAKESAPSTSIQHPRSSDLKVIFEHEIFLHIDPQNYLKEHGTDLVPVMSA